MWGFPLLCTVLLCTAELCVPSIAQNIQVELARSPDNLNNITLICTNNSMTLDTADFWMNSTDQPLTSILSNYNIETSMIQFLLHPDIEGSFFCGDISAELESSNNLTLVAYPIQDHNLSDFYTAKVSSSITLSCPFARGALTQHYSYSWIKGANTVVGGMQQTPRFSGDFSLTIQNLTLSDNSEYLCRVFVTNPIGNNWTIDSDPIQLSVYASSIALSPTPVPSSVSIAMNITSRVKPHSRSPLKFYEVAFITIGVCLFIFLCAVCSIGMFKVRNRRQSWHTQTVHGQSANAIELHQINNFSTSWEQGIQAGCEQGDQASCGHRASCLSSQNEGNYSSLQVQIRESQNLEGRSVCEGPECAAALEVQPVATIELSQSQEHTVPPTEVTRDGLPIGRSIGDTNHRTMHTPNGRLRHERQSRPCSGLTVRSSVSDAPTTGSAQSRGCPNRNSEVSILQSSEDYQVEPNELMFLGPVRVLMCDSRGGKFQIAEHDITLSFPQDAVPDTIQVEVEVGVAIHGLFDFPDDIRPISVLVWVHARSPNFRFQKPIEISLPHYLKLSKNDVHNSSNLGLGFMVTDREEDDHHHLIFKEGAKERVSYKQKKAIISTTHFCYMCLSAKASVIAEKSRYLLTQVQPEPITSLQWQIHFCVSYNLCSFTEMIKQQYRSQGNIINPEPFQFILPPAGKQPELEIHFQRPTNGWQLTLPMYKKQIPQSAVELWKDDVSVLQDRVRHKHFPPRVTVEVAGGSAFADTTQLFSFEGAHTMLEREVHLRLPGDHVAQHKNTLRYLESRHLGISWLDLSLPSRAIQSHYSCPDNMVSLPHHQAHPDEPTEQELGEVMKVIAGVMGPNWRTLIPVLGIPPDKEQEILQDSIGLKTQILKMLQMWRMLHRTDGTSTRVHLAAILRKADPCLNSAVKILGRPLTHSQS